MTDCGSCDNGLGVLVDVSGKAILPPVAQGHWLVLQDSVVIDRPANDVWRFVRDMENYPLWFTGIVRMASADDLPPATIGKRYDEMAIAPGGKEETITVEIIAADEEKYHLAIQASLEPFVPRFDYRVVPVSANRCVFHWRSVATGRGLKAMLLRPVFRMILKKRLAISLENFRRILSGAPDEVMTAAQFWLFGPAADVIKQFNRAARPKPKKGEIIVRQCASSINHIDCHRRRGYGRNAMRVRGALNFPVILGNDISGEVAEVGEGITGFKRGDPVVAVKAPSSDGAFAEYVSVAAATTVPKPSSISYEEAGALPYTFFTAWSALFNDGGLTRENASGKRVFVQGGAGGVGSMAIQIARYLGAEVIASCGPGQRALVEGLGASSVYDFSTDDYAASVRDVDIAFCTASVAEETKMLSILKSRADARYVTVIHPTLQMTDELGLLKGFMSAKKLLKQKNKALAAEGKKIGWTLFKADPPAVALFREMLDVGALKPVIDSTYDFADIVAAQERLESGKAAGKVVIQFPA
ncbi:MAG: alcohol dehydrogenase catalytic domain-containing protein [Sphingorhabdus sp.]